LSVLLILLRFRLLSIAFVAFWQGRFWCETGVVRSQSRARAPPTIVFWPDFFPPWLDGSHVTMLRLERLGRDQVGAMISDLATGKELERLVAAA
jgi:hypothetical protein